MATIEMVSRRDEIAGVTIGANTHAGLWLERYAEKLGGKGNNQAHVEKVTNTVKISAEYKSHFDRWETYVTKHDSMLSDHATVLGRMVVGLGAESVLETAITLHRTYGVPYIPGSALKGLARSAARRLFVGDEWNDGGECHKILFGTTDEAGFVTFHDALLVPESGAPVPLDLDVMTVHHAKYYGGANEPPADWDSPNPVAFVTARGTYLIALEGPKEWTEKAMEILAEALWEEGIGAKTAAGYGRLKLQNTARPSERKIAKEKGDGESAQQIEVLKATLEMGNAADRIKKIFALVPPEHKRAMALEIIEKLTMKSLKPKMEKTWVKELLAAAEGKG